MRKEVKTTSVRYTIKSAMTKKVFIVTCILTSSLTPYFVLAQFSTTSPQNNFNKTSIGDILNTLRDVKNPVANIGLTVESKILSPGAEVGFSVNTYSTDLQKINLTWSHNGKQIVSGKGETSITIILGPAGKADTVTVVAIADTGERKVLQKTIYPTAVHLTWHASSYTPPWYRGKALHTPTGIIKVVATPDFRIGAQALNPKNLIYTWRINDRLVAQGSGSGAGKNLYSFESTSVQGNDYTVSVDVRDPDDRLENTASIDVKSREPELLFYERHPLFGTTMWRTAKNIFLGSGAETTLEVEPYFAPVRNIQNLAFEWTVGGQTISPETGAGRVVRFVASAGRRASQEIKVSYKSLSDMFVRGSGTTRITFGEPQ